MKKVLKTGIYLLLAAVVLAFTACPQTPDDSSSDATLKSITIAGRTPESLGEPASSWEDVEPGVVYLTAAQLANAQISATTAGGTASYATSANISTEPEDFSSESTVTLVDGQVLWVQVTNGSNTLIYAFVVHTRAVLTSLSLTRSGTTARAALSLGTPADSWNAVTETGELLVGTNEVAGQNPSGGSLTLGFTTQGGGAGAQATYALAKGAAAPSFGATVSWTGVEDGDWLYVRSVRTIAGDETLPLFYKIKLTVKNDNLALTSLTVGGQTASVTADSIGWNNFGASTIVDVSLTSATQPLTYSAAAAAATTTVGFGTVSGAEDAAPAFSASSSAQIPSGSILCLELVNELGEKGYYRVRVVIGSTAASISGATIAGKTVTLAAPGGLVDVDVDGNPTIGQFLVAGDGGPVPGTAASINFTIAEETAATNPAVAVTGTSPNATVSYTWGAFYTPDYFADIENWQSTGTGLFEGGNIVVPSFFGPITVPIAAGLHGAVIFIRVTSESNTVSNVYAISCTVDPPTDLVLSSVTIGGVAATLAAAGSVDASQGFAYNGEYGTVRLTAEQAGDGTQVKVIATGEPGATITYSYGLFIPGFPNTYVSSGYPDAIKEGNATGEDLFLGASIDLVFFALNAPPGVDGAVIFIEVASAQKPGRTATYAINCSVPGRDFTASLANNTQYGTGHQMVTPAYYSWILPGGPIQEGDVYVISFDVVSDFAFEELDVFFVDPSPPSYWRELTDNGQGGPIGTTTPTHIECTVTAKDTGGSDATTNSFGLRSDAATGERAEAITLTITDFKIRRQRADN